MEIVGVFISVLQSLAMPLHVTPLPHADL